MTRKRSKTKNLDDVADRRPVQDYAAERTFLADELDGLRNFILGYLSENGFSISVLEANLYGAKYGMLNTRGTFIQCTRFYLDILKTCGPAGSEERDDVVEEGWECSIYNERCVDHGFIHGAEAEELREGVKECLEKEQGNGLQEALVSLLDRVNARDSLAYLEAKKVY